MDVEAYLRRINYYGSRVLNAETLRDLQVAHLRSVPFENLSIHVGQPIVLDDDSLFEKIVTRRRGGFCYELNGLFAALLRALGFDVLMLSAGVWSSEGGYGPDFDHMALQVTLERPWLVDVGFGDSFLEPLLLEEDREQVQGAHTYRIRNDGSHQVLMRRQNDGDWENQYRFTMRPYNYAAYTEMCHYHQTSPQSPFTRKRVCTMATPEGRITLSDLRLITSVEGGGRQERALTSEDEYNALLRQHFGIQMTKMPA